MLSWHKDAQGIIRLELFASGESKQLVSADFVLAFKTAVESLAVEPGIKGIMVSSSAKDFCLSYVPSYLLSFDDVEALRASFLVLQQTLRKLETLPYPSVAIISGRAEGFGLELALACQRRVASKEAHTALGFTDIRKGVLPALGGMQRLARLLGFQKSAKILLEGSLLPSELAFETGIIDEIAEAKDLEVAAMSWLKDLSLHDVSQSWDKPEYSYPGGKLNTPQNLMGFMASNALVRKKTWGHYPAYQAISSALYEGGNLTFGRALDVDLDYFLRNQMAKETQEILMTLGVHQSAVLYEAEQIDKDSAPIQSIAIIGAGLMGSGIAEVVAKSGIKAFLLDKKLAEADRGRDTALANLKQLAEKGIITEKEWQIACDKIIATEDFKKIADVDLVIEAVYEDEKLKIEVLKQLTPHLSQSTLIASNTSKLSIQKLAKATGLSDCLIGLHFFSPVGRMPLVEVIKTPDLTQENLNRGRAFVNRLGKVPIIVNDSYGFFTTRVIESYMVEGLALLASGVQPALIENAARLAGMPVGPLALADEIGLDVLHRVSVNNAEIGKQPMPESAAKVLAAMVKKHKRLGRKNQKGFYDYPNMGQKKIWDKLTVDYPVSALQPDAKTIQDQLIFIQVIEAEKAFHEGVIENRSDGDLASILGIGFPAFTGGVFAYKGYIGEEAFRTRANLLQTAVGERFELSDE